MDNLLGQISSKLASSTKSMNLTINTKQVCDREDSETYAKRTITEIETCLGFTFHGAAEEEAPETITNAELETLNTQVEAALQSGLNFKDRFRTNSRKRLLLVPADSDEAEQDQRESVAAEQDSEQQHMQQQPDRQQQQQQQARQQQQQQQQPGGKPGKPGLPLVGGLKLTVGSNLETGEWKTGGVWLQKDKAEHEAVPSNLQIISADDLVKVKELGRGCFGSVWLAKWRGVEVALKELLNSGGGDTNPVEVFQEAEKLASLRHPCVMGFYGIVTDKGSCATVAEYICHGSLRSGLLKIKKKGINDKRLRAYVAMQSAYGMEYLHLHYMVHFDLKCDNLLCDLRDLNKPVVKIGDLGLSKTKKGSFISGNMRGTLPWMAPELFPSVPGAMSGMTHREAEDRVTEKVDVFSFGVVLWEIWTLGDQPYPNLSLQEIFAGVMTGTLRPAVPPGCDPAWVSLMQDCWHAVPRMRPSFTDIITRLEAMLQRWSQQVPAPGAAGPGSGGAAAAHGAAHGPGGVPRGAA
ncbi:hypothetical protein OEZ85_010795 [Tetradesmus obliquus]|uniref:Protein kinase domain-containing protein n=1 Tax=Tetradesmus obliquus TaxID=3088 RepID=A0ABY8TQF8_TETOB|nr:hypothetical protein OEZ85_010795 [Tetradesmus obliquus]